MREQRHRERADAAERAMSDARSVRDAREQALGDRQAELDTAILAQHTAILA